MVSVGTIVWLSSELMFFAALFAMYFTTKAVQGNANWPPTTGTTHPVHLNVWFAGTFTVVLILSSVTCQFGVFAAERGDVLALRKWFLLSFFMGAIFIAGQSFEYFVENTFAINSHPYGSVYYLTTGFHGLHVTGGLFAFLFVLARTSYGRFTPDQATYSIVVSYYWHFVDIVWVGLFATIYLLK
ncbi:MAG: cytochrome c oxidase subunit [Frankiaceae bacterium]|jgi:cytochrome c oxidase subunit 3|nr:cytochrome c oxidase subunit [Frankiaceae bacterium]